MILSPNSTVEYVMVVARPNTGVVTVEYEVAANDWVVVDTINTDSATRYDVRNNRIRLLATLDAEFAVYGA